MRPISLHLVLAVVLAALVPVRPIDAQHAGHQTYAGNWHLDPDASTDLPPMYGNVREHLLSITQDDSTLTVAVTITDTAGHAQRMTFPYHFAHPVPTTTQVFTPNGPRDIPATLTATRHADGGIDIDIRREMRMGNRTLTPRDHERWSLSPDGRRLVIDREFEMPGPGGLHSHRSRYIFVRD